MNYRNLILTTLAVLCCFTISARAQEAVLISGNPNAPPVVWEQYEQLVGLGIDLTTSILDELGIGYQIKRFSNWQQVQDGARQDKIDLIVSAYRNQDREQYLDFSIAYLNQPTVIMVKKGNEFKLTSWEALKGKKGVSNIGESYGQEFDTYINEHLDVEYHQFERAIQMLKLNMADYLIVDLYTGLIYTRLLQGEEAVTMLDPPATVQSFHLAISKDSPLAGRIDEINAVLRKRIDSGFVEDSMLTHFDDWQKLIDRRSAALKHQSKEQASLNEQYAKEQREMAQQRIIGTMVNREGPSPEMTP
jgi:polar amino acid transport system substrate-binding protein